MGCRESILRCCTDQAAKVHAQATDILRVFTDTSTPHEDSRDEGGDGEKVEADDSIDVYGV